jgi:glycosyltransferase involved in cell wall biosynthesis
MKQSINLPSKPAVLMVAYHFPPQTGSSGLLRTLKFSRYLPDLGWQPVVVTAHPRAYESIDPRTEGSLPSDLPVIHAFALDTKKHLSFRGAYPDLLALPDRWAAWVLGGVPAGLLAIRKHRADILFTTFPICTAVLIGLILHWLTGKPWVVDLRDSMTEEDYPRDPRMRRVWRWIERRAVRCAARVIFTTPSTRRMYLERYPDLPAEKCLVISNGYDEEDFTALSLRQSASSAEKPLRLLHTGTLYPEERDPRPFFRAVSRLKSEGRIGKDNLQIAFRAPGSENLYRSILDEMDIADIVQLQPHIPYRQSLQECADADALLLFQAANCDHQIPAKAYEYLRVQRPVFALTTQTGDTAALLNETGGSTIVNLASADDIHRELPSFLDAIRAGKHPVADRSRLERYARHNQARALAACLSLVRQEYFAGPALSAERLARGETFRNR